MLSSYLESDHPRVQLLFSRLIYLEDLEIKGVVLVGKHLTFRSNQVQVREDRERD